MFPKPAFPLNRRSFEDRSSNLGFLMGFLMMIILMLIIQSSSSSSEARNKNIPLSYYRIRTIAGQSVGGSEEEEEGVKAVIGSTSSLAFLQRDEKGQAIEDIIIADRSNLVIKRLTFKKNEKNENVPSMVKVLAGVPMDYSFYNSTKASQSRVNPQLLAISESGEDIYFTDNEERSIKKIDRNGELQLIVKSEQDEIQCKEMSFEEAAYGSIVDLKYSKEEGDEEFLYMVDESKRTILKASLTKKTIKPITKCVDGQTDVQQSDFEEINSIFVKRYNGKVVLYVADKHTLKKVEKGAITTIAGNGIFTADIQDDNISALNSSIYPNKIFVNSEDEILFTEFQTSKIRKFDTKSGKVSYIQKSQLFLSTNIIQSPLSSNIYVEENFVIYKINGNGKEAVFGNGDRFYFGDGKKASQSRMNPLSLHVSSKSGKDIITVLDSWKHLKVRVIDENETIQTIMGGTKYPMKDIEGALASTVILKKSVKNSLRDNSGNFYLTQDAILYKLNEEGRFRRVIGTHSKFAGDGKKATTALLNEPSGVFYSKGLSKTFIADTKNNRIRVVSKDGTISTLVGSDDFENTVTHESLMDVELDEPKDVFERNGILYYTERWFICKIDLSSYKHEVLVGNLNVGLYEDNKPGLETSVDHPEGLYVTEEGDIYFADSNNHRIRKWEEKSKNVSTIAGTGQRGFNADGILSTQANLDTPTGVYLSKNGEVFVADKNNHRIRKISNDGKISTLFQVRLPHRVIVTSNEQVFVSHEAFISKYDNGTLTGVAGARMKSYTSYDDNPFETFFGSIIGLSFGETESDLLLTNPMFEQVRKISKNSLSTVAGGNGDGLLALNAKFGDMTSVVVTPENEFYIADSLKHTIRKVSSNGIVSTIAGIYGIHGYNMYDPDESILNGPMSISLTTNGDLYFIDQKNYCIRKISKGVVSTIIGIPMERCDLVEGKKGSETCLRLPQTLAVSPKGDCIIFTDISSLGIYKYMLNDKNAVVQKIAGHEFYGYNGDGEALSTMISEVTDLAFSNDGSSVYFVDGNNNVVRKLYLYCPDGFEFSDSLQQCIQKDSGKPEASHAKPELSTVIPEESEESETGSLTASLILVVVVVVGSFIVLMISLIYALYHLIKNRSKQLYLQLEGEEGELDINDEGKEAGKFSLGADLEEDEEEYTDQV